jgi:hypothetical protein
VLAKKKEEEENNYPMPRCYQQLSLAVVAVGWRRQNI